MLELTASQAEEVRKYFYEAPRFLSPLTNEVFALVRIDEYERLKADEKYDYDDSPWTEEERNSLVWQYIEREGLFDEFKEYDDWPELP